MNIESMKASKLIKDLEGAVRACEAQRMDPVSPQDISLQEYVQERWQMSMEAFHAELGVEPGTDSIQNILNLPDQSYRWLIPEIYRDAIRLGLRKAPIYPNVIAAEQTVSQTSVTMPAINMSEAAPKIVGTAETILVGDVSFGHKTVKIYKYGRGVKIPYEVKNYVALNVVGIFLQDFGVQLGMGIDSMMINTLMNGDQPNGSESAPVIGIKTPNDLTFRDMIRIWVRMARLGKSPKVIIAGEEMSIDMLELLISTRTVGEARMKLNVKSPMPQSADLYVHGQVANNQALIIDPASTIIKLNAQPLLVESEKIVSNQTEATYCSLTTGFSTMYRDSRVVMDQTVDFDTDGFPSYMDPTTRETVTFD